MNATKVKETVAAAEKAAEQGADKASRLMGDAKTTASKAVADAKDLGQGVVRDLKSKANDAADEVADGYSDLRGAAEATLANAKASLAEGGDRLANALRDAAEGTSDASQRVLGAVAGSVSGLTDRLQASSLSDLVVTTKAFARRNPGAFAAGAAVAGFALARFMQASARKGPRG